MLTIDNINVIFNKGTPLENHAIKNFSLNVSKEEFITIIGGNGAGKSTFMGLVAGEIKPTNGKIYIDNSDITNLEPEERSYIVSRVFQDPMIGTCANLTIEENLAIGYLRGKSRGLSQILTSSNKKLFHDRLAKLGIGLENRMNDKVSLLSGGQRQILSLIMASLQPSKILLLDEHTAALDPKMAKIVMELTQKIVEEYKLTTLMITHCMSQALKFGCRTIMMNRGAIVRDLSGVDKTRAKPHELVSLFEL